MMPCPHLRGLQAAEHLLRGHAVWNQAYLGQLDSALVQVQLTMNATQTGQEPTNQRLHRQARDLHDALCGRIRTVSAHLTRQEQAWEELFVPGRAVR